MLHFLALGSEAFLDLDAGFAAVEIFGAVGVGGIKGSILQSGLRYWEGPRSFLFRRWVKDRFKTGTQVDAFKAFRFKKVSHAIPPFNSGKEKVGVPGRAVHIGLEGKRISVATTEILFCGNLIAGI